MPNACLSCSNILKRSFDITAAAIGLIVISPLLLVIALIGMPLVVGYTVSIYWIFRGKVRLENTSY